MTTRNDGLRLETLVVTRPDTAAETLRFESRGELSVLLLERIRDRVRAL